MATRPAANASGAEREGALQFSRQNWIFLLLGLISIVAGYVLLDGGSIVAAPLLLVLGYVVLIPIGIIR